MQDLTKTDHEMARITGGLTLQDLTTTDLIAGVEHARPDTDGPNVRGGNATPDNDVGQFWSVIVTCQVLYCPPCHLVRLCQGSPLRFGPSLSGPAFSAPPHRSTPGRNPLARNPLFATTRQTPSNFFLKTGTNRTSDRNRPKYCTKEGEL